MGAYAVKANSIADLETEIAAARNRPIPTVIVIETDPSQGPNFNGSGSWWDVGIPAVADTAAKQAAYANYLKNAGRQRLVN
jgi:3D-(3,5/4)-trihydroxycyclohexane-1,2-dione acylhydrolase (decyclizing)